jgi:hypothetical protein
MRAYGCRVVASVKCCPRAGGERNCREERKSEGATVGGEGGRDCDWDAYIGFVSCRNLKRVLLSSTRRLWGREIRGEKERKFTVKEKKSTKECSREKEPKRYSDLVRVSVVVEYWIIKMYPLVKQEQLF